MKDKLWDDLAEDEYSKKQSDYRQNIGRREKYYSNKIISKELKLTPGMVVLDAGCGYGRWTVPIAKQVKKIIGIDLSGKSVQDARKRAIKAGVKNAEFRQGDISKMKFFKDSAFDTTFLCLTLQHIIDEQTFRGAVAELERVTKPGGRIIFVEIVKKYARKRSDYIACRSPKEYKEAFKHSTLVKHIGIDCPYLKFAYRLLLRKILEVKAVHGDVKDEYAVWDAMEKSKARRLIYFGYSLVLYVSVVFNVLSRRMKFLSPLRLFVFRVEK